MASIPQLKRKSSESGDDNPMESQIEMNPLDGGINSEEEWNGGERSSGVDNDGEIELKPLVHEEGEPSRRKRLPSTQMTVQNALEHPGTATQIQVAVNIFISFVGAGLLGMPYAFAQSGWLLGSIALSTTSAANVYAMLLLVKSRKRLVEQGHTGIKGYGDMGRVIWGEAGENFVNVCLVISQVGFATAYIIFIASNFHNVWNVSRAYVCFGCVPLLCLLVQARDMKTLSPFSLLADVANLTGLSTVLFQDFKDYHHETIKAVDFSGLIYVIAITIYSMEGVGLILPLESSCAEREKFPSLLRKVITGITALMCVFGACGYITFGSQTMAPITLNLDGGFATFVKLALCLALYLTYPVMIFPVTHVLEDLLFARKQSTLPATDQDNDDKSSKPTLQKTSPFLRAFIVLITAVVAWSIPDFGKFLGLVGASICTILGFILPCYFHLQVFERSELKSWELALDILLILFGVVFGVLGTYDSFRNLLMGDDSGPGES